MRDSRKGNAAQITNVIVAIGVAVITIAVVAIMLGAFISDYTGIAGCNSTNQTGCGYERNVTLRGLSFLDNATSKFSTAGTIVGVMFLLGVIGVGGYLGVQGYRKLRG